MKKRRITQCYFDIFLENYKLLFDSIVTSVGGSKHDVSSHINIALQELLYVMIHFDTQKFPQIKKGSFSSFLYKRVKGKIMHDIQKFSCRSYVDLNDNFSAVLPTDTETPMLIEELMSRLTEEERSVMEAFCENKTLRETGVDVGRSACTVAKIRKKAIHKLRKAVGICQETEAIQKS